MMQVLFEIPTPWLTIPIYGYGFMLFCAYLLCTWLATRLGRQEGYPKEPIQDLTVWLFVTGIIGARLTFIVVNWDDFHSLGQYFSVWDGGLVFYGSIFGAAVGYAFSYRLQLRHHNISHWKMADVVAPCLALGLCLGRLGCLLNGCCYGNVACASCPAISFPLSSPPRYEMVRRGHQTPAGFLTFPETRIVAAVDPKSPLDDALKPGDAVEKVNGRPIERPFDLVEVLGSKWPRGESRLELAVKRADQDLELAAVSPRTIELHPTQIYESISMALLLFFLLSYYPYKKHDGSLMVLFMFGYGVHRFLNEMLRTDTEPVAFGMTLSQNISVLVLIAATVLALIVRRRAPTSLAA